VSVYRSGVAAFLSDEFYPVVISGMKEPFLPGEIELFCAQVCAIADHGIRTDRRHVVIVTNDPVGLSAAGRRKVADALARYVTTAQNEVTLASFLPIDSTLVRGALTAFRWFAPETIKTLRAVDSMPSALQEALAALAEHGTPFTGDLKGLRRALQLEG
jgi:hypothetical protein